MQAIDKGNMRLLAIVNQLLNEVAKESFKARLEGAGPEPCAYSPPVSDWRVCRALDRLLAVQKYKPIVCNF